MTMTLRSIAEATYTINEVVKLLAYATGRPVTQMEVANLTRPGKLLDDCRNARGAYDRHRTMAAMKAMLRRRLAAELGRTNQRFLDADAAYTCPECKGEAVQWDGRWRCERGHEGSL